MRYVGTPPVAGGFLREVIAGAGGGPITVEHFMREALYHPRHGYYSRRVRAVGRAGDFATSATLHGALGRAVAAWAAAHRGEVSSRGGRWHLIECGGGGGELADEIRRALGWWAGRGLRYHLVEISEGLRAAQQRRLAGWRNVRWHTRIEDALAAAGGGALIFSNEFVDAFPCVQLARDDAAAGGWREVGVAWPEGSGGPVEMLGEWDRAGFPAASALEAAACAPGQRVEIHRAYRRWLDQWLPHWRVGRLMTIDYGDTLPGLYHQRPRGTLRAYCRHQRFEGPEVFQRMGQQDLTADVNFTDLQAWGDALGLTTTGYGTQADFLRRWLYKIDHEPALRFLLDPDGAGGAFKVLEQVRAPRQYAA